MTFIRGDKVLYHPTKGKPKEAVFGVGLGNGTMEIRIGNDPFPVLVPDSQVSSCDGNGNDVVSKRNVRKVRTKKKGKAMPDTATKGPSAKELRQTAQGLGVEGWQDMGRKELKSAIKKARKASNGKASTKTKKADTVKPARKSKPKSKASKPKVTKPTKAAPKVKSGEKEGLTFAKSHPKPTPDHGVNPFRPNSALFRVAKLLLKGGKRESLASKLSETVELHPYQKDQREVDLQDYDKRLLLGAQTMRDKYGYGIQRTGRGLDGSILVFVPGGPTDPRGKSSKKSSKKR